MGCNLEKIRTAIKSGKKKVSTTKWIKKFENAMDDDFNTPKVIALLLEISKHINKTGEDLSSTIYEIGKIFNIDFKPKKQKPVPKNLKDLIKKREDLRKQKKFKDADKIRSDLKKKGILLDDTPKGVTWKWI